MSNNNALQCSRFLSMVLRHRPELIGVQLDSGGWVAIETLLAQCRLHGQEISRALLDEVVSTNPKQRFAISEDSLRIRASQGHTIPVELGYVAGTPPEILFHGTVGGRLPSIRSKGITRMRRHHVHLSLDAATAQTVGSRRGSPIVLQILAGQMHRDGYQFFKSANGVWLTEAVPSRYIVFEQPSSKSRPNNT